MSETKEDGGPVYPITLEGISKNENETVSMFFKNEKGMSLRDWFAGMALQGWLASYGSPSSHPVASVQQDEVARYSYKMADAMIKARKDG